MPASASTSPKRLRSPSTTIAPSLTPATFPQILKDVRALLCDPSMATWFVDRLEEKGLVERRSLPSDRRVKTVVLTPRGARARAIVWAALFEPPEELLALDGERLEALKAALAALPRTENPFLLSGPPGARP